MSKKYIVDKNYQDSRFDKWFKRNVLNLPQSLIEKIIRQNKIKVNNKKTKSSYRVQEGDEIKLFNIDKFKITSRSKTIKYKPSNKEIKSYEKFILENNENFLVVNKPSGVAVQSGTKSFRNIIDILKNSDIFLNIKPYIVHRLDKETSGVLIIAKNREYAQLFTSLFRIRKIHKTYLALVYGKLKSNNLTLKDELITYENDKKVKQKAITHLKVIKKTDDFSYLELNPITGRKHQIRKQLFNIGHPILGDKKYFLNNNVVYRDKHIMLQAYKIKFMIENIRYNFQARYNLDFEKLLKKYF